MKQFFLSLILILFAVSGKSQILTSSNLPIVIINTDINPNTGKPYEIPDEPKTGATMKIIFRPDGSRNYITDANNPGFLNYSGRIAIEKRGSSSQTLPKKAYGLTTLKDDNATNNNVSILEMPKENDWVLNSLAFDPSLIRNYLSYDLARSIGNYAARGEYCEVVINGDYKGLYIFMEKLKIDGNRINVVKMSNTDNAMPELTGGYITKADKTTGGDPVAWTMQSYSGSTSYLHDNPKPSEITSQQNNYIREQFTNLQNAASAQNASIVNGFPSIIDIPSFVDFILINELASNADAYQYSTYFHKDRNGKLRAGPVWDFDLTYGNDLFHWGFNRSHYYVWQFDNGDNTGSKFWRDLYNNPTFRCYLSKRWQELISEKGQLNYAVISAKIDRFSKLISEASVREYIRWGTVPDLNNEIASMKLWIQNRMNWMNGGLTNYTACANPVIPPLVISKISYHPMPAGDFESDDLEFIEITNNSNQTVNLTGFYFSELGISYQFPANATIRAGENIILAGNERSFQQFYGLAPFGSFTRDLSNKSEKIVLADAFGNVIDSVRYQDSLPWPAEADGGGYFLQLKDLNTDNSLGENWTISLNLTVGIIDDQLS
ncbi:MAG: secretion system protein Por, partial [Bacteroidetes bacterium]